MLSNALFRHLSFFQFQTRQAFAPLFCELLAGCRSTVESRGVESRPALLEIAEMTEIDQPASLQPASVAPYCVVTKTEPPSPVLFALLNHTARPRPTDRTPHVMN